MSATGCGSPVGPRSPLNAREDSRVVEDETVGVDRQLRAEACRERLVQVAPAGVTALEACITLPGPSELERRDRDVERWALVPTARRAR